MPTLYVNHATGDDSRSYATAQSASTPWLTIGRAAWGNANRATPSSGAAAQPGDTVMIADGTYATVGQNDRYEVAYNPVNEGTSGAHIRFEAVGTVNLTYSSGAGPVIGANDRDYIDWVGAFTINEATCATEPDTGHVVYVGETAMLTGGKVDGAFLTGTAAGEATHPGDNYNAVRMDTTTGVTVRNCTMTGYGAVSGNRNHSGVTTYYSTGFIIENNTIYNCGNGVYLKANFPNGAFTTHETSIVRKNLLRDNLSAGLEVHRCPHTSSGPLHIYQNVLRDNAQKGLHIQPLDLGSTDPAYVWCYNNTVVDNFWGIYLAGAMVTNATHRFWNNIVKGGSFHIEVANTVDLAGTKVDFQHNIYHGASDHAEVSGTTRDFATWQSTYSQDQSTTNGPASQNVDPSFENYAGNDFRLAVGSVVLNDGVDGLDLDNDASTTDNINPGAFLTGLEIIGAGVTATRRAFIRR